MSNIKCKFCSKYHEKLNDNGRCTSCEKEYLSILANVIKRYGESIQKLADR